MKKSNKILSIFLSLIMVLSTLICGNVLASNASTYSEGDIIIYNYMVQCDSIIQAFEGYISYPTDCLEVLSDDNITVYDGKTGSNEMHDDGNGTVRFNGSGSDPVYNFTKESSMIEIIFEVTSSDFDPESISATLINFYDDDAFTSNTNTAYNYKHVIDNEVISGGHVDLDNGESYTTEPTEATTTEPTETEYTTPTDTLYLDYKIANVHDYGTYDTPFTNNNDGTYSLSLPVDKVSASCAIYDETTKCYFTLSKSASYTLNIGDEQSSVNLEANSSKNKALILKSSEAGTLNFTFDFDNKILYYSLDEAQTEPTEPSESTEPSTTEPTTTEPATTEPTTTAPTKVEYNIVYNYTTEDGNNTITKSVTTDKTDAFEIASLVAPEIVNPYATYALGECTLDGTTVTANFDSTEKKYSVSVDGTEIGEYGYKEKATVQLDGTDYTFYVTGNVDLVSGSDKKEAIISLDGLTVSDERVSMEFLATANVDSFSRMGVAFAASEKSEEEIKSAVAQVTDGTQAYNSIAIHNSDITAPNESGSYQFTYAPFISKAKATTNLYFYTFAVDADGEVYVSDVKQVNIADAYV